MRLNLGKRERRERFHRRNIEWLAAQCFAILDEGRIDTFTDRAEYCQDRRLKQPLVSPLLYGIGQPWVACWIERLFREAAIKLAHNQRAVAVDIRTDLQHRDAPVTAGQRNQIGLGHDHRLRRRAPCEALYTEANPDLLGKRRSIVLMKNDVWHRAQPFGLMLAD